MKKQIEYLQKLFYDLLNDYGKVFITVRYSEQTIIGIRGFTEEEKKKGIILVFNQRNNKNLQWTEDGSLIAMLGFGGSNRIEKCFLHSDDIVSVFSPDAKIKIDRWDIWDEQEPTDKPTEGTKPQAREIKKEKVVSLDTFRKSKN